MTDKTETTAHAEITLPISADLQRMCDAGAAPEALPASLEPTLCQHCMRDLEEGWTE